MHPDDHVEHSILHLLAVAERKKEKFELEGKAIVIEDDHLRHHPVHDTSY